MTAPTAGVATDVLIVGGGPAGLAAGATASELGLRSMLIEKAARLGGQLHVSAGRFSAAGTRLQHLKGIDDSPDLHFADIMRLGHGMANPEVLRAAVDAAPEAVDWLETLGLPFHPAAPSVVTYHEPYSRPRTYWGDAGDQPAGRALYELFTGKGLLDTVERGPGFIDVRHLVNLDNYGPGGEEWHERVSFSMKTIERADGSSATVFDTISFEVLSDYKDGHPPTQKHRTLRFLLTNGNATTAEIADHLDTSQSRANNMLKGLHEEGFIVKGNGNRGIPHSLTDEGSKEAGKVSGGL